jgi:DNA-binding GntR family transcriptional regulator
MIPPALTETSGNSGMEALSSPIELPSIPDVIYRTLRRDIARGVYKPGPIRVRPIAERFGVSATPVREALRRLEAEGLVSLRNRQIVVNPLSIEEMREIYAIRCELESFALRRAAPRVAADKELLARLDSLLDEMDRVEANPDEWRAANEEFHLLLYGKAELPRLEQIIDQLWVAVEPYLRLYVSTEDDFRESQGQHRVLLGCVKAGKVDEAAQALREHLKFTAKRLAAGLGAAGSA